MANQVNTKGTEVKRVGKFGLVGVINTVLDFLIYNLMFGIFNLPPVGANAVAVTGAMTFSFFANKKFVFNSNRKDYARQAVLFVVFTVISLYVIQNVVIYVLTEHWTWPLELGYSIINNVGISLGQDFVYNNGAKVAATFFSMVWNYVTYKKFVFKQ